jgi:hypothetical protein
LQSVIKLTQLFPNGPLDAFDKHRDPLVNNLRDLYQDDSKSFDADKAWHALTRLAKFYFWREEMKEGTMPASIRAKRLEQLAKALGGAHDELVRAMQDDVGGDLFKECVYETGIPLASALHDDDVDDSFVLGIADGIKNTAANLATLKTAARQAAHDVRPGKGRPKGTSVLPPEYIIALGDLYRRSTGSKLGEDDGSFAQFVLAFLAALRRRNIADATVTDAIRDARTHSLQNRPLGWPSPFDE